MPGSPRIRFIPLLPDVPASTQAHDDVQDIAEITLTAAAIWIAGKLAAGIVGAIGAEIWRKLSGTWDIRQLYEQTTQAFETALAAEFERHELNQAIDSLETASRLMAAFLSSPAEFRLNEAEIECRRALAAFTSGRHKVAGFGNVLIAGGLLLSILQERLARFPSNSEVELIRYTVDTELRNYVEEGKSALIWHLKNVAFDPPHLRETNEVWVRTPLRSGGRGAFTIDPFYSSQWMFKRRVFFGPKLRPDGTNPDCVETPGPTWCFRLAAEKGIAAKRAHVENELAILNETVITKADDTYRLWEQFAANARVQ